MSERIYYRVQAPGDAASELLVPGRMSRVWSGEVYRACAADGCSEGQLYVGQDRDTGESLYERCEACKGTGEIEDLRRGVSVCRSLEALAEYLVAHHAELGPGQLVVGLRGPLSPDEDHDDGAVLILPTEIVSVEHYEVSALRGLVEDLRAADDD